MQKASESYFILCFTHHYDETRKIRVANISFAYVLENRE
jgi:hypothetical protein